MKFTIGMPTFDDFDGVYFTVQALWLYHGPRIHEVIIIDNNPGTKASQRMRTLAARAIRTRYVPYPDIVGTAAAKNRVFAEASAEHVVCLDSHVLLLPGALDALAEQYQENPKLKSLLSGPLVADDHVQAWTHLSEEWGSDVRGKWQSPTSEQKAMKSFPITNMGTGLLACRADAWLGFNPAFKGFGGEEWYIQQKFLRAGREVVCVNGLKWMHRFGDQTAAKPYPLYMFDRARNYFIGVQELGDDTEVVRQHFVNGGYVNPAEWQNIVNGKDRPCGTCGSGTVSFTDIAAWHASNTVAASDVNEHLPTLAALAKGANVVDCGDRQGLTVPAYAAGGAAAIVHVAPSLFPGVETLKSFFPSAVHAKGTSLTVDEKIFKDCDLLFLDTEPHNADHVYAELKRLHGFCRHYIVLHDTVSYGEVGQLSRPGILAGVRAFVREHRQWVVIKNYKNNHGLCVLSCAEEDKKKLPTLGRKALNFAAAWAHHVKEGRPVSTPEIMEARRAVCDTCDARNGEHCGECGCPIEAKAAWAEQECPLERWPLPMASK